MFSQSIFKFATRVSSSIPKRAISISTVQFAKQTGIICIQDYKEFQDLCVNNEVPVIVDIFAEWCKPCKELGRRFDAVMPDYEDKVCLAKVDIDKVSELIQEYEIEATPTVLAMKNGKVVSRFTGLRENDALKKFIKEQTD